MFNFTTISITSNICLDSKVTVLPPASAEDMLGDGPQLSFERLHVPTRWESSDREHILAGVGRTALARMGNPEFDF
jgi:hypothetical protein